MQAESVAVLVVISKLVAPTVIILREKAWASYDFCGKLVSLTIELTEIPKTILSDILHHPP